MTAATATTSTTPVPASNPAAVSVSHPDTGAQPTPLGPPSKAEYRDGMARLAAAVNIITTDGPAGMAGFTASAVCSVTDEPPTLLVCLNRSASVHPVFAANQVLCVNVLAAGHETLSNLFGGKTPMPERFAAAQWRPLLTGAPALTQAQVSFDARVVRQVPVGSHDVLFCEVVAMALGEAQEGLAYFQRAYRGIGR